jgi:hypothetical protein
MSTFQDRVRELKGFLGKLLPRAASRSRRSLHELSEEVSGWPVRRCLQSASSSDVIVQEYRLSPAIILVQSMTALLER